VCVRACVCVCVCVCVHLEVGEVAQQQLHLADARDSRPGSDVLRDVLRRGT
jgi:hypothetical protein